jgi:hypothetical protein
MPALRAAAIVIRTVKQLNIVDAPDIRTIRFELIPRWFDRTKKATILIVLSPLV